MLREMVLQHPNVVTSAQIQRRLGITGEAALLLKRRIQVFASTQLEMMQEKFYEVLSESFQGFDLPRDTGADLSELSRQVPIPQADTVVLYSCSQRANKGRKRYKRKGQTSSIYRSESLGGEQMGTLVNTFGIRKGPAFFDSISDQRMETLNPLIRKYMPHNTPLFTDMGYRAFTGKNHRMVNHNARSKDKRYKFARNRWSNHGVHCNVAEGLNGLVKQSFAAYRWIKPRYSQLYLNEFAFIRNLKHFDILDLIESQGKEKSTRERLKDSETGHTDHANPGARLKPQSAVSRRAPPLRGKQKGMMPASKPATIRSQAGSYEFEAPTLLEIQKIYSRAQKQTEQDQVEAEANPILRARLRELQLARHRWLESRPTKDQRRKQREFEALAQRLWESLHGDSYTEIRELAATVGVSTRSLFRILPVWYHHGLVELRDLNRHTLAKHAKSYDIRKVGNTLIPILYVMPKRASHEFARQWAEKSGAPR